MVNNDHAAFSEDVHFHPALCHAKRTISKAIDKRKAFSRNSTSVIGPPLA
jgi:hypothetical protein